MSVFTVDIGVYQDTERIKNRLLHREATFATKEEAEGYLLAIETWLANIPTPEIEKTPPMQEFHTATNEIDIMTLRIFDIIKPRDPELFPEGDSYHDSEADAAVIERRPYNGATSEAGWES